jgi:hypothetical protein
MLPRSHGSASTRYQRAPWTAGRHKAPARARGPPTRPWAYSAQSSMSQDAVPSSLATPSLSQCLSSPAQRLGCYVEVGALWAQETKSMPRKKAAFMWYRGATARCGGIDGLTDARGGDGNAAVHRWWARSGSRARAIVFIQVRIYLLMSWCDEGERRFSQSQLLTSEAGKSEEDRRGACWSLEGAGNSNNGQQ